MGKIKGRIIGKRDLGGIKFITILKGNKILDVILRKDLVPFYIFNTTKMLKVGDIAEISYKQKNNELIISDIRILYKKRKDFKSNFFHDKKDILCFTAKTYISNKIRQFFNNENFFEVIDLPFIHMGTIKQDAFYIRDYFKKVARLTTSNALYLNIFAFIFLDIFTFTRTFRAEPSKTKKHLSEFTMLEIACIDRNIIDIIELLEKLIKFLISELSNSKFRSLLSPKVIEWKDKEFNRLTYKEISSCYNILGKGIGKYEIEVASKGPVFVVGFPPKIASWISLPQSRDETVSFNLLLPNVGEVAEGNQKITTIRALKKKFSQAGILEQLKWYIKLSPYEKVTLSGFGLGLERLIMWLFDIPNIRKIVPFYRDWRFAEEKYGK